MRIGVLGNDGSWYVERLCTTALEMGHAAVPLQFPTLTAGVLRNSSQLRFGDHCLTDLDAIIVRTMPPGSLEQVVFRMDALAVAQSLGVRIVNSPKAIECAVDKFLTTQKLAAAGLPVPDTIVCETAEAGLEAFENLGGDVVVKPVFGAEGRGIMRVSHPELALRTFRTLERLQATLYLQRFVNSTSGDHRILLLDGRPLAAMQRFPAVGDFRANIAQNGRSEPWQPDSHAVELSLRAAEVTGCTFAGIDLMYDDSGQAFVIEVNAVPGWRAIEKTCDINVARAFLNWISTT
ncbi:MAG: RimK family alpha-L-glutamate ligase [Planctomycetaceae bacterium]|nr:RimK family alpha-L-glutamate ligase [Planctomycetaceae bacterium]